MTSREGRFADGQLYYRVWDVAAPRATVVLAHGYAEHSGRYEYVGDALAAAGFTTWALDHFGHGQSEGARADIGSLPRAVANLDAFVDIVAASGPLFLVGHSMGGLIATAYAEAHQDRLTGLILTGPAVAVSPALEMLKDLEEIPAIPMSPLVSRDPDIVKSYENDPLNYLGPMPRAMINAFGDIAGVRDHLKDITIPVLVMHGDADALVPFQASEDIAAMVSSKDVTLKIWPELYHEILNEPEKDDVIGTIVAWIANHL